MAKPTARKTWQIRGYDSLEKIYSREIPYSHLSERQLIEVLRRLVSRHLTEGEIIASSLNGRAKARSCLLEANVDDKGYGTMYSCGTNPYYHAWYDAGAE